MIRFWVTVTGENQTKTEFEMFAVTSTNISPSFIIILRIQGDFLWIFYEQVIHGKCKKI